MTTQMRGLRNFAAEVETFVREKCSPQESGSSAPEPGLNRTTQSASSAAASSSAVRAPVHIQTPEPPRVAPPDVPTRAAVFNTIQSDVRAGTIRVEISDPDQWSPSDVAILQNQGKTGSRNWKLDL